MTGNLDGAAASQLARAQEELHRGRSARALELLDGLPSDSLEHEDYWFVLAGARYEVDGPGAAASAATEGLSRFPQSVPLLGVLARAQRERGNVRQAEQAYLSALAIQPEHPGLLSSYALLCALNEQPDKAAALLARAESIAPDSPDVKRSAATIAYLRGDDAAAARRSSEVLQERPDDITAHILGASMATERGRHGDAAKRLNAAVRSDPHELRQAGAYARYVSHPLMAPMRVIERIGSGKIYVAWLAIVLLGSQIGYPSWFVWVIGIYLVFVVYSWTVPYILRRKYLGKRSNA